MKYDDLEDTKELFDIVDIPTPIEDIEMEGASKDHLTDELNLFSDEGDREASMKIEEPKKVPEDKKSLKNKWMDLQTKYKALIIGGILLLFIIIIVVLFLVFRKKEDNPPIEPPKAPEVIVEKDQYIYQNGVLKLLDDKDVEIGIYECKNQDEKLCFVVDYNDEDDFDHEKNIYEDETVIPRGSKIYLNRYVFIYDNKTEEAGNIILYDIKSEKAIGTYKLVKGFSDTNEVILKDTKDKYGLIVFTEEAKTTIDFTFDYLGFYLKDMNIVGKVNNKYGIYNKEGKLLSGTFNGNIKSFNNNYIVVEENNKYQVYDYKSKKIYKDTYDFIKLYDNFAALISDSKLYIRDYKDGKYMEEGIILDNTYYNPLNIYDSNNTKKETKEAFRIDIKGEELDVIYKVNGKERAKTINIKDASISANLKYLSYLDGKLYFYQDEEKQELFGTYTCSNKNYGNLENCVIATDAVYNGGGEADNSANGWIPIFNRQYVFIYDTIDKDNPTVVLYDLVNNKTLSKYTSVNTSSGTLAKEVTFKNTSATYVIAKNKNNKFGMIRIGGEVKGGIPFDYESITKLKDYYVVENSTGVYALMTDNGSSLTDFFAHPIVDYKDSYLTTLNDGKYYVYNFNGSKVDETGYKEVTLENDYFVSITSEDSLFIGKYNPSDNYKISKDDIKVSSKDDYTVTKENNYFVVKIKSTGESFEFNIDTGDLKTEVLEPEEE